MRWLVAACALGWFATGSHAHPQLIAATDGAPSEGCRSADASRATVAEIGRTAEAQVGACVTVSGWFDGVFLYPDAEALYRHNRHVPEHARRERIAVSGLRSLFGGSAMTVTGSVRRCADESPRDLPMRIFCNVADAHYVTADQFNMEAPTGFVRLSLATRRTDQGDLAPLAEGETADALARAAQPILTALQDGDQARFAETMANRDRIGADTLFANARPAAALWPVSGPAMIVLGWRMPSDATPEERSSLAASPGADGVVCAASPAFAAANLWPADTRDIEVHRDRPYVCVALSLGADGTVRRREMRYAENIIPEPRP